MSKREIKNEKLLKVIRAAQSEIATSNDENVRRLYTNALFAAQTRLAQKTNRFNQ